MAEANGTSESVAVALEDDIADQHDTIYRDHVAHRIAIIDGANIAIAVKFGMLTVSDGAGRHRRERRWSRPDAPERIIILSRAGWLSMHVIGWCEQTGTQIVAIDPARGRVRFVTTCGTPDGRLHHAQAIAASTEIGLTLARELLAAKVRAQGRVALRLGGNREVLDGARRRY